ncbi:antimicrobial peptide 1-like [Nymphaea colorata]|nr:antimicrobial peptide 1-like [Nymphaea colorata]
MARSLALVAALVAMVMAVEFAGLADAKYNSYLRVYEAPGCHHRSEKYEACGCHNLKYNGGYKYDYNEKHDPESRMVVYFNYNCEGYGRPLPQVDSNKCKPFPFKSVYIKC